MPAIDRDIQAKVRQWLQYGDDDLLLARLTEVSVFKNNPNAERKRPGIKGPGLLIGPRQKSRHEASLASSVAEGYREKDLRNRHALRRRKPIFAYFLTACKK